MKFVMCSVMLQGLAVLTPEEDARLGIVLGQLRDQASRRRLMMYQYFKDYDRVGYFQSIPTLTD